MSAFMRIYTRFGKENFRNIKAFTITHEHWNKDSEVEHVLTINDDETVIADITNIIKSGQPCNVFARFENEETEAEAELPLCTICESTGRILCSDPQMKLIRYRGLNDDN